MDRITTILQVSSTISLKNATIEGDSLLFDMGKHALPEILQEGKTLRMDSLGTSAIFDHTQQKVAAHTGAAVAEVVQEFVASPPRY